MKPVGDCLSTRVREPWGGRGPDPACSRASQGLSTQTRAEAHPELDTEVKLHSEPVLSSL